MTTIKVKNLTKTYGDVVAVDQVSFSVGKGKLFGLLGPNGSGKTTMIKMLTGQIEPLSGELSVLGIDVKKNPLGVREQVGIIPEQETPPSFLTSEEYLQFVCKIRGLENSEDLIDEWLHRFDFLNERNTLCKDLSRGTRQKLMVAQAFFHSPRVAFIDEPLINLDPLIQRVFKDYLLDYVKQGNTIFFSTHVLEIAEEICTEIGILHKGRMLHKGSVEEVLQQGSHLESFFIELVNQG
jgi:ABC-2 type transport system ATP-binding protein